MDKIKYLALTGFMLLIISGTSITSVHASTVGSSAITSNFNGTKIASGSWVWFSCNFKLTGTVTDGDWVELVSSNIAIGSLGTFQIPDGLVTFSSSVTSPQTFFDQSGNLWRTILPLSSASADEIFLSGYAYKVTSDITGGPSVTWTGSFISDKSTFSLNWKWGAAVYTYIPVTSGTQIPDYNALNIVSTHTTLHAGTPQAIEAYVTGGARGGGGSNYTGSWSSTDSVAPTASFIQVLPENGLGALAIIASCFAAILIIKRYQKKSFSAK